MTATLMRTTRQAAGRGPGAAFRPRVTDEKLTVSARSRASTAGGSLSISFASFLVQLTVTVAMQASHPRGCSAVCRSSHNPGPPNLGFSPPQPLLPPDASILRNPPLIDFSSRPPVDHDLVTLSMKPNMLRR